MLSGIEPQEVIALIKCRLGNPRAEGPERKLGLIVEGGAMRGVYTAGSLLGLHQLGANHVFDAAYGTSAGAINAAHFLSGEGPNKVSTYYKVLTDSHFYNPKRIHKILDIDYFVDEIMKKEMPLELDKLRQNPTPLKIGVLNWNKARAEVFPFPDSDDEAWSLLHACVSLPVLYNRRIPFRGQLYADGCMAVPFPLRQAIDDGMTDLLVLLTHDPIAPPAPRHRATRALYKTFFAKGRRDLMEIFDSWPETMHNLQRQISGMVPLPRPMKIAVIAPRWELIGRTAMDSDLLRENCAEMADMVLEIFGSTERISLPA